MILMVIIIIIVIRIMQWDIFGDIETVLVIVE